MNFFDKPENTAAFAAGPTPITRDRIAEVLDSLEQNYGRDSDGDVAGFWDGNLFYFLLFGPEEDALKAQGHWNRIIPADLTPRILEAVNEWGSDHIWPTGHLHVGDDGALSLYGYIATDLTAGVTDEQLSWLLRCSIGTSLEFFAFLDEKFPGLEPVRTEESSDDESAVDAS